MRNNRSAIFSKKAGVADLADANTRSRTEVNRTVCSGLLEYSRWIFAPVGTRGLVPSMRYKFDARSIARTFLHLRTAIDEQHRALLMADVAQPQNDRNEHD